MQILSPIYHINIFYKMCLCPNFLIRNRKFSTWVERHWSVCSVPREFFLWSNPNQEGLREIRTMGQYFHIFNNWTIWLYFSFS